MSEELAKKFHEAYERLAPEHYYETRKASAVPWENVPATNKALMIAVCSEVAGEQQTEIAQLKARLKALQDVFEPHYLMGSFGFIDIDSPELLSALEGGK